MSPRPRSRSAPLPSRMTRESTFDETLKAMRDGRFALMTPVRTSVEGRCVATTRWMPTARAFCARRTTDSSTSFGAIIIRSASSSMTMTISGIGSSFRSGSSGCCAFTRASVSGSLMRGVVLLDVAHLADVGQRLEPLVHQVDRPLERVGRLLRIRDDRRRQVRQVLVDLELDHLRVDQDQLHLVRPRLVDDRRDQRVQADALARPGRAGDQQVRHPPQVVHDRLSVDVLAEGERQKRRRALEPLRLDHVAHRDDLAAARVGHLDADARAPGQPLDADRLRRERERQVLGEAHDLVDLDARRPAGTRTS